MGEGVDMKSLFLASSLICSISLPHLSQADIYTGVYAPLGGSCEQFSDSSGTMTIYPKSISFYECGCSLDDITNVNQMDAILFNCAMSCEGEPMGTSRRFLASLADDPSGRPRVLLYDASGDYTEYTYCAPLPN